LKKIICLVGKSGSGKSAIAALLSAYGHTALPSYTTRPKRSEDEDGHIFVSESEFDLLDDLAAYNNFNGYSYGATREHVDDHDIYIVDMVGLNDLISNVGREKLIVVNIVADTAIRFERMLDARGLEAAASRVVYDESAFAELGDFEFDEVLKNNDEIDLAANVLSLDYIISSIKYYGDE
jgi:guanylate kinase